MIRAIITNPAYTGRLYWNRLDFRTAKLGEGPVVRRSEEEWIESERPHEPIIPDDWFERSATELRKRSRSEGSKRRSRQRRFYQLRGIVHCATGHNPLRMHGKERKGITYYACCYRIPYGDKAAEALGHGKWQYVREDMVCDLINRFFRQHIFGPERVARFREQVKALVSSAFTKTRDLQSLGTNGAIAGAGFEPATSGL
jgi:site-specific DNA recombinase